jgi:exodeoxyribonuclease VII small subunit
MSFEKALERLEAIVEKLEGEELGLDASLALFEEGIGLSRVCQEKLSEVERRVEIVLKDAGGKYALAPFADGEEAAEGAAAGETESEADGGE